MSKKAAAYSLIELLVASAIFAGMILAAVSVLTVSATLRDEEQSAGEVTNYAEDILRQISMAVSYSTSLAPTALGIREHWVAVAMPDRDDYGRRLPAGSSITAYCVSARSILHVIAVASLPAANPCPTDMADNPYDVTLNVIPVISQPSVSAVRIEVIVKGKVGGVLGGRTGPNADVSYTTASTVEYGNPLLPYETAN